MTETPLDEFFAAMQAAPEDTFARLRFYDRLAGTEIFVMLSRDPEGEVIDAEIFDLEAARFVLGFDLEERLSGFAGRPVPFVAMPGRALIAMLDGQDIGLALNLDTGASEILLPPDAIAWMAQTLAHAPRTTEARPERLEAPRDVPENLLKALDSKLAQAGGLARTAWLSGVTYDDGARGHILGVVGALPGSEAALAAAINEALVFSGLEAGALDVVFLEDSQALTAEMARFGLRFDLPEAPDAEVAPVQTAPGSDPGKPPILR